jgi:CheY-like chemotaxis protein
MAGALQPGGAVMTHSRVFDASESRPPRAPSVLLLDDEPAITLPVATYLRRLGWTTQVAAEAEEAMALAMFRRFDLAILDLCLTRWGGGGAEGLAVVEELRRLSPSTRILVLSAHVDADVDAEARRRGADAVLRKPQSLSVVASVGLRLMGEPLA